MPNPIGWVDPFGLSCDKEISSVNQEQNKKRSLLSKIVSLFLGKHEKDTDTLTAPIESVAKVDKAVPIAMINGIPFEPTMMNGHGFHGMRVPEGSTVEDLFNAGLPLKGTNLDLINHVKGGEDTAFRGTAPFLVSPQKEFGGPLYWAEEGGIVVEIEGAPMFDTNQLLEGRIASATGRFGGNPYTAEAENAVLADVKPENIKRIAFVEEGRGGNLKLGEWIDNPNFNNGSKNE